MSDIKIVRVDWWDAEGGDDGWTSFEEILEWAKKPFPLVTTVGRVIYENDLWIVLLASWSNEGDDSLDEGYHAMKIPKLWVHRIEEIK